MARREQRCVKSVVAIGSHTSPYTVPSATGTGRTRWPKERAAGSAHPNACTGLGRRLAAARLRLGPAAEVLSV